jgi:hypothetical protein
MNLREDRDERTLESWKEIGAYLQRDARTARNWEKEEGLPIHRHSHNSRSSVYAYPGEIDAWRASRKIAPIEPAPAPVRHVWRMPAFALTGMLCLIMVGNGIRPQIASAQQKGALAKRLLCADCGTEDAAFTRDGRSMVFAADGAGDLAVRDMSTGPVKRADGDIWDFRRIRHVALALPRPEANRLQLVQQQAVKGVALPTAAHAQ